MNLLPIFIDSDLALGSPSGDIDDGFAVTAILKSGVPIAGISSVFGNCDEESSNANLRTLADLCGYQGKIFSGAISSASLSSEASHYLSTRSYRLRILAIGPLTNVARALAENPALANYVTELIVVMTNYRFPLPAFRFFDFNHWNDPTALRTVMKSPIPITLVPCDVARRLRIAFSDLDFLPDPLGPYFRRHCRRWFRRAVILKGRRTIPVWDLSAAMYAVDPGLFQTRVTSLELSRLGAASFGSAGGRPVTVVEGYHSKNVWDQFVAAVSK